MQVNGYAAVGLVGPQSSSKLYVNESRTATETFFRLVTSAHSYATGGSNDHEFWGPPNRVADAVTFVCPHMPKDQEHQLAVSAAALAWQRGLEQPVRPRNDLGRRSSPAQDMVHWRRGGLRVDPWLGMAAQQANAYRTEETCTQYNSLKIARALFQWTGSSSFADYHELALLNGIIGMGPLRSRRLGRACAPHAARRTCSLLRAATRACAAVSFILQLYGHLQPVQPSLSAAVGGGAHAALASMRMAGVRTSPAARAVRRHAAHAG